MFWTATQRPWKSIGNISPMIGANLGDLNLCDGFLCCKSSGIDTPFLTETMEWTANIWPQKTTGNFSQNQLALLKSRPSAGFFVGLRWNYKLLKLEVWKKFATRPILPCTQAALVRYSKIWDYPESLTPPTLYHFDLETNSTFFERSNISLKHIYNGVTLKKQNLS